MKAHNLLSGITALKEPDYHALNADGPHARILHALLCAYAKHEMDTEEIGWDELGEIMHNAICEAIGDVEYQQWMITMSDEAP